VRAQIKKTTEEQNCHAFRVKKNPIGGPRVPETKASTAEGGRGKQKREKVALERGPPLENERTERISKVGTVKQQCGKAGTRRERDMNGTAAQKNIISSRPSPKRRTISSSKKGKKREKVTRTRQNDQQKHK